MKDLLAKLEAAPEGSRELDAEIHIAVVNPKVMVDGGSYDGKQPAVYKPSVEAFANWEDTMASAADLMGTPRYTTSIDAALTLPPAWDWEIDYDSDMDGKNGLAVCRMGDPMLRIEGEASTPALAVCIARLRARDYEASR